MSKILKSEKILALIKKSPQITGKQLMAQAGLPEGALNGISGN
jgi:hypothetical protein